MSRSHNDTGASHLGITGASGDAKICNLNGSVRRDQDVLRFDVPVDEPALVGESQRRGYCLADAECLVDREWTLSPNDVFEVSTLN